MRIEKDQMIAGGPAREIRRFMRTAAGCIIRIPMAADTLRLSNDDARQLLRKMEEEGWIAAKRGYWEATEKGHALTMATAAKSLHRKTAERLVAEVVDRAQMINEDFRLASKVELLAVFGSTVTGTERPNDVDVACKLVPRHQGAQQGRLEDQRRLNKAAFRNTVEWAAWPKLEVLKKLKARWRGLSIQELGTYNLGKIDHHVVFSAEEPSH
jgi:hypothetical protein